MRIHPGIRIDKIPVEGWLGLLWGSVIMIRTLIDVPDARWFFLGSIPGGAVVAIALYFWRTHGRKANGQQEAPATSLRTHRSP
jgi:hypothetical protein